MAIEKRVSAALTALDAGDANQALHDICSAIEATCQKLYGKGGRLNYKNFIADNLELITRSAFGSMSVGNVRFSFDPTLLAPGIDGMVGIEDIMYHLVRCGLYHNAEIPHGVKFEQSNSFLRMTSDGLVLPNSLVLGFIIAVITCPANRDLMSTTNALLTVNFLGVPIDKLWGKKRELWSLYKTTDRVRRLVDRIDSPAPR
jgi:hypothetical protein